MANPKKEIENTDARDARIASVDMKLEIVVIPVSNVDRVKEFYRRLGWRLDAGYNLSACRDQYIIPLDTQLHVAAAGHHG
jgi:hypothetical protein